MKFFRLVPRTNAAVQICFLFFAFANPIPALSQAIDDDRLPDGTKSDGCTLIGGDDLRPCCVAHDREYFFGGTVKERRASDKRLFHCVSKKKSFGAKLAAPFIWLGVRVGGLPFLPTRFRWGFGKKSQNPKGGEVENTTTTELQP